MITGFNKEKVGIIKTIIDRTKEYIGLNTFYWSKPPDKMQEKSIVFRFEIENNKKYDVVRLYLKISNVPSPGTQRFFKEQLIELFKLMFPKGVCEKRYSKKIPFLKVEYSTSELNKFIDLNLVKFRRISEINNASFAYKNRIKKLKVMHIFETTIMYKDYEKFLYDLCNVDFNEDKAGNMEDLLEI